MSQVTLFTDILPEEQERMRVCFQAREFSFQNHEIIFAYSHTMNKIGLILSGRAVLYYCDEEGNQYMIDELKKDAVFGEPFLLPADSQNYYVQAEEETRVIFIDYTHVIKRCENACRHHSQLVSNLLQMIALQSRQQVQRIYVLSRTTIRKKIMAYLEGLSEEQQSLKIRLPLSYTDLAGYLSVDRSAMTRELKSLEKEGVLEKDGRNICLKAGRYS